jgi:hypothetical protein
VTRSVGGSLPALIKAHLHATHATPCRKIGRSRVRQQSIPFLPVLEIMRGYFGIEEKDSDDTVRDKVAGRSLRLDRQLDDALPFLYEVSRRARSPSSPSAHAARGKAAAALRVLEAPDPSAEPPQPTVLLFEDLHWWDGGSEAFLENQKNTLLESGVNVREAEEQDGVEVKEAHARKPKSETTAAETW